jgi:hypothetical protein
MKRNKLRCPMYLYNLVLDDNPTIFSHVMFGDLFLCIAPRCLSVKKTITIVKEKPMLHKNRLVVLQHVEAVFFSRRKIVYQI